MKKEYEKPKAEKLVFDYKETVVASGTVGPNANPNAARQAQNSCYTHNTDEVTSNPACLEEAEPKY